MIRPNPITERGPDQLRQVGRSGSSRQGDVAGSGIQSNARTKIRISIIPLQNVGIEMPSDGDAAHEVIDDRIGLERGDDAACDANKAADQESHQSHL